MHEVADHRIVVDARPGIDNYVHPDVRIGVDDGHRKNHCAFAQLRPTPDYRRGMDNTCVDALEMSQGLRDPVPYGRLSHCENDFAAGCRPRFQYFRPAKNRDLVDDPPKEGRIIV